MTILNPLRCANGHTLTAASRSACAMVLLALMVFTLSARAFQHPGIPLTVAGLDNIKTNFSSKVLGLAVMVKPGELKAAVGGSLQQQFDAQYQLVTPETSGQLAR